MSKNAPGKSFRKGISMMKLYDMFPDEESAEKWFEAIHWSNGRVCGNCGSKDTSETKNRKPMPYWCKDCRKYFSVRTGTTIARSNVPLRKWAFAVYLFVTNLKGVSSMRLHREIEVTQKTAWFMLHRLRESWSESGLEQFIGPVEVDETYMGGKRKNMSNFKRKELACLGRGTAGKTAVVGAKDRDSNDVRAQVVESTDAPTLQSFVIDHTDPDATVYTDDASAYDGIPFKHESVRHSVGEFVRDMAHTNGMESFWSMLKRGHTGTYHHMSTKHLQRYVNEFSGRHCQRSKDTIDQMVDVVAMTAGKKLMYKDLVN